MTGAGLIGKDCRGWALQQFLRKGLPRSATPGGRALSDGHAADMPPVFAVPSQPSALCRACRPR